MRIPVSLSSWSSGAMVLPAADMSWSSSCSVGMK